MRKVKQTVASPGAIPQASSPIFAWVKVISLNVLCDSFELRSGIDWMRSATASAGELPVGGVEARPVLPESLIFRPHEAAVKVWSFTTNLFKGKPGRL